MNKKVIFGILAVLTFFIGCIFVDNFPVFSPLVIFLTSGICFLLGYLTHKDVIKVTLNAKDEELAKVYKKNLELITTLDAYKVHTSTKTEAPAPTPKEVKKTSKKKEKKAEE